LDVRDWLGSDNQLGIDIWQGKYQYNNETFSEWLNRISGGNEDLKEEIFRKRFFLGGRILANRGLYKYGVKTTYSNCYVLPAPEDSIESIYDTAGKLARTFSYGGGVGIDISNLAPRGARVNNTAKETSGAVSFMDLFSLTTGLIGQNGRRGALMLSIDCSHPDLEEFIEVKSDLDKITKANISIRITDEFMSAVTNNAEYELQYVREETGEVISKVVNARDIFEKLAKMNWDMAEPGMLFWDRISNWNLLSNNNEFEYAGVNPCAEEPLPAGGSCLLGSINLSEFVIHPYTPDAYFDVETFINTVEIAVKALNEVLDEGLPLHPLEIQRQTVSDWRQIGLGILGIADMLVKLGFEYGSEESLELCDSIAHLLSYQSLKTSCDLAKEYGAYPKCNNKEVVNSKYFKAITDDTLKERVLKYGLRNSQLLTIAPTGTLSTMAQLSGGIEPYFAKSWKRKTQSLHGKDVYYIERPKTINELMDFLNIDSDDDLPDFVVCSADINPINRIKMQSVWQKYIDASISSTLNLPNSATVEDVMDIYMAAWEAGLKGITIYRDGCRRAGVLTTDTTENDEQPETVQDSSRGANLKRGDIIFADDDVIGKKRKLITGCGSLHCTAFFDPITGDLLETYLSKGSTGGCNNFMVGLSRMISTSARAGVDIDTIVDQLQSCGVCPSYAVRAATKKDTSKGSCCPTAVGYALKDMWLEMQEDLGLTEIEDEAELGGQAFTAQYYSCPECSEPFEKRTKDGRSVLACPNCGEELFFEGGCNICKSCGFSKCD